MNVMDLLARILESEKMTPAQAQMLASIELHLMAVVDALESHIIYQRSSDNLVARVVGDLKEVLSGSPKTTEGRTVGSPASPNHSGTSEGTV